ncbi:MAG TPA: hypothetical protein VJC39_01865 [Candidatus Nanoarchaeia archaeon]|nr:hypothetical protein [Candidatus Nanoarchaeia archaeon]
MKDRAHPVWPAYEEFNQSNPSALYDGMKNTIETIWKLGQLGKDPLRNRRLRLGLNTNNSWGSIYKDLVSGEIIQYFDAHITEEVLRAYHGAGDGNSLKKPARVSLALALGLLDSCGDQTLHVGDTLNDLKASRKVIRLNPQFPENILTVGACYGYEGRERLGQGIVTADRERVNFDYLIDKPKELVDIVKELL